MPNFVLLNPGPHTHLTFNYRAEKIIGRTDELAMQKVKGKVKKKIKREREKKGDRHKKGLKGHGRREKSAREQRERKKSKNEKS